MSGLDVSLLLGLLAHSAAHTAPAPVCVDATLDRIEWITDTEGVAVVEVPEYPTLSLPGALAKGMRDGTAVDLCAAVKGQVLEIYLAVDAPREKARREEIKRLQQGRD